VNPNQKRSRLSFAHERPELANDNPLIGKAPKLKDSFETKRCPLHAKQLADNGKTETQRRNDLEAFKAKRRNHSQGSGMVRNHKPYPELKPSPALSHSVKAQTHYQDLAIERKAASHTTAFNNKNTNQPIHKGDTMDNTQNNNQTQPTQQSQSSPTQTEKPTVIRDGSLKASIFHNVSEDGKAYYTTKLAKTYTDQDGNPRDTQNFSQSDLLRVAELGREAYAKINGLKRGQSVEQSQSQSQNREAFKQSRRASNNQEQSRSQQR
jgi:hypothetical protein